jgi:hypothetical protein
MGEPLAKHRELIEKQILPKLADPIRYSPVLAGSLTDMIQSVKAPGLEGLVAKRRGSRYEPGLRSGAWMKMRVNQGQELVIAEYTPSPTASEEGEGQRSSGLLECLAANLKGLIRILPPRSIFAMAQGPIKLRRGVATTLDFSRTATCFVESGFTVCCALFPLLRLRFRRQQQKSHQSA